MIHRSTTHGRPRAQTVMDDLSSAFIGRDALIKNKRASGRDKDLIDLRLLHASLEEDAG